jgi:hypothetical protein
MVYFWKISKIRARGGEGMAMRSIGWCGLALGLALAAPSALALEGKPKLGPDAVPITQDHAYLRQAPAPDYWAMAPYYLPQFTTSACSVASVAMAINVARGLPASAEDTLVTQTGLLEAVGDAGWTAKGAEGGDGVRFAELVQAVERGLAAYDIAGYTVESFKPADAGPASLAELQAILAANEASAEDVLLVYFNQGVLTGDWDGPHVSPLGAYDAATNRVLVMDVDREWYVPYWASAEKLLAAMLKPTSAEHGPLAGETGGLVWLKRG